MLEFSLGIAGTAKNTGKTTTTAAILSVLRQRGIQFFLTSIGFDGEDLDNVTGLPKPKVAVEPGDIVATADRCLTLGTARFDRIADTGIQTALGPIQLLRVTAAGLIVIAGPNKSSEVRRLLRLFRTLGPGFSLFDGALSRIAPLVETDGLVLATGAAFSSDIPNLAVETNRIEQILQLPYLSGSSNLFLAPPKTICVFDCDEQPGTSWSCASLLCPQTASDMASCIGAGETLVIPGIIGEEALDRLTCHWLERRQSGRLIFADPVKLLVAGKASKFCEQLDRLQLAGIQVGVLKRLPLLAVTINPFYPQYRIENQTYHPAYVDFHRLQVTIRSHVETPVYNVVQQGAEKLVDTLLSHARPWRHPDSGIEMPSTRV